VNGVVSVRDFSLLDFEPGPEDMEEINALEIDEARRTVRARTRSTIYLTKSSLGSGT
jgi:hypothetical protein